MKTKRDPLREAVDGLMSLFDAITAQRIGDEAAHSAAYALVEVFERSAAQVGPQIGLSPEELSEMLGVRQKNGRELGRAYFERCVVALPAAPGEGYVTRVESKGDA